MYLLYNLFVFVIVMIMYTLLWGNIDGINKCLYLAIEIKLNY